MTKSSDTWHSNAPAEIRRRFEERARTELAAADALAPGSDLTRWTGALLADVALIKGLPGPAEAGGGDALSGADGRAAHKAMEALGWGAEGVFCTLSRPAPGLDSEARAARLRMQIEAVDPALVVALDGEAAADVADAFGVCVPKPGVSARVAGRRVVAVEDFEMSLSQPLRKKQAWQQLQCAKPDGPVY